MATAVAFAVASYATTQFRSMPLEVRLALEATTASCGLAVLVYIRRLAQRISNDKESGVAQALLLLLDIYEKPCKCQDSR